jgi:hypothetical protein
VHALSEFKFCPRAGLCLYEQEDDDDRRDQGVDVSYLPIFEQAELEQTLKAYSTEFWGWLLAGVTGAVLFGVTTLRSGGYGMFRIGAAIITLVAIAAPRSCPRRDVRNLHWAALYDKHGQPSKRQGR